MRVPVKLEEGGGKAYGNHAIKLYNLGRYGIPQKGGTILLSPYEILHLLELKKVDVFEGEVKLNETQLAERFAKTEHDFVRYYLVYKDIRFRGQVVQMSTGEPRFFRVYERGQKKDKMTAKYYVYPLAEGSLLGLEQLRALIRYASEAKKTLLIALLDAGGDISYMRVNHYNLPLLDKRETNTLNA